MAATLTPRPGAHDRMLRATLKNSVRALRSAIAAPALPESEAEADRQPPSPPTAVPLIAERPPSRSATASSSFRYLAARNVGAMYCYRCGHFSTHQLVCLTSGRSRWHHRAGGYLRQCMSCGDMDRPALDDLLSAGIPPDQWYPARRRLTVIGLVVTMVTSLAIMMAAGVAIGAALV